MSAGDYRPARRPPQINSAPRGKGDPSDHDGAASRDTGVSPGDNGDAQRHNGVSPRNKGVGPRINHVLPRINSVGPRINSVGPRITAGWGGDGGVSGLPVFDLAIADCEIRFDL